jgi:SNF2 family DNA or RNA helicase
LHFFLYLESKDFILSYIFQQCCKKNTNRQWPNDTVVLTKFWQPASQWREYPFFFNKIYSLTGCNGLVIHRLLMTGRIRRVLVIVPRSLVHQWFIELFRKFSLGFCLFDEGYCREARLSDPDMNPFSREQCGIIAQDTVLSRPDIPEMLLEAGLVHGPGRADPGAAAGPAGQKPDPA